MTYILLHKVKTKKLTVHYLKPGAHKMNYYNNLLPLLLHFHKYAYNNIKRTHH